MAIENPYYNDRATAFLKEYISTEGDTCYCGGVDDVYYRLFAQACDSPNDDHAKRGLSRPMNCCTECESCDCWCNSDYIRDPDTYDPNQDATFNTTDPVTDPPTFADMELTIAGIEICDTAPDILKAVWATIKDTVNKTWNVPFSIRDTCVSATGWRCCCNWVAQSDWIWTGEYPDEGRGWVKVSVGIYVHYAHNYAGTEPGCFRVVVTATGTYLSLPTVFYRSDWSKATVPEAYPKCSDETTGDIPNRTYDEVCPFPTTGYTYGGTATVRWGTQKPATPPYYTAVFGGDIVACDNCTQKSVVTSAITKIKDPAGIVLPATTGNRCGYTTPYLSVPNVMGVMATGSITLTDQPADGNIITLNDGTNPAKVFEFDSDGSVGEDNIAVTIGVSKEATMINLIAAINVAANLNVNAYASTPANNICSLLNINSGTVGNQTITKTGDNIAVTGMSGGVDAVDHSGWYYRVTLTLAAYPGYPNYTQWQVTAKIVDLRHKGSYIPDIDGIRLLCPQDMDTHLLFDTHKTGVTDPYTEDYNCDSPPNPMDNRLDCDDPHTDKGVGGACDIKQYFPCAEGGSVSLTAGSL